MAAGVEAGEVEVAGGGPGSLVVGLAGVSCSRGGEGGLGAGGGV